ncbi:hypothetical protein [Limosilactobacillus sp.]|uniref:hypothetical protein n=1 Tax=Limosilactobacillus sp. TaxID=2773925 RepID=UPI003EFECD16
MSFRQGAPWPIPPTATGKVQMKNGYHQVKYTWPAAGWRYEARWHERTPWARLITYPSWRLDRTRPGKGYGPDAAPRLTETWVGDHWLPVSRLRYAAARYNHGCATSTDIELLKAAHPAAKQKKLPGK